MKKQLCIAPILVSIIVIYQSQLEARAQIQTAISAQVENTLIKMTSPKEPVEITKLQIGNNDIAFGKTFTADEDWLRTFSCEVKNISGKAISELYMNIGFATADTKPGRVKVPLTYAESFQANQTIHLSIPPAKVSSIAVSLEHHSNIRKGEFLVEYAKFQDGTIWLQGETLGRRDPKTGKRKRIP